jgi:hypothetical protein
MSFLKGRNKGLPYGAIPYSELLNKLEETDTDKLPEDHRIDYLNYLRSEIVDRSLDKPYLESDTTKRDPSLSKSIINLRYNGSRGEYENPRHPEAFIGFMDSDPRALDNNPRMDQYTSQISTRMPNLEIRMGHNSEDTDPQRPWSNQSLNQCRVDIQNAMRVNTKVFTDERDGHSLNRNVVSEYDHNKKQLVYKDILPVGLDTENTSGKSNSKYSNNVRNINNDNRFSGNDQTLDYASAKPKNVSSFDNVVHSHFVGSSLLNNTSKAGILQQESKIKNTSADNTYNDALTNNSNSHLLNRNKYINKNIDTDFVFNEDRNLLITKNKLQNPITNPTLLNNDIYMSKDRLNVVRRKDNNAYSNGNKLMHAELLGNSLNSNDTNIQKHMHIHGNNNNITLVNSTYNIPEFKFKHLEIGKHASFPNNQNVITKTKYDNPYGTQDESMVKSNGFRFSDDVSNNMRYNIAYVTDQTHETQIRRNADLMQEHKVAVTNNDNIWTTSDINTSGKMQRQARTSATEDQSTVDMLDTPDYSVSNAGGIVGSKSLRGDQMPYDAPISDSDFDLSNH